MTSDHLRDVKARYEKIARRLSPELLSGDDDLEHDLFAQLTHQEEDRLLGFYTRDGLLAGLEAYGILDILRVRGYADLSLDFDLQPYHHTLRLLGDGLVLCECRIRRSRGCADPCIAEFQRRFTPNLLVVEWLTLTDPRRDFTADRPALPGQISPGSGIGDEVFVLLYICARRLRLDGVVEIPQRFHNAYFYRQRTRFVDPEVDGRFQALMTLLNHHTLYDVAWALEEARIVDQTTGQPMVWAPRPQLMTMRPRLAHYFESAAWRRARARARHECRPRLTPRAPAEIITP